MLIRRLAPPGFHATRHIVTYHVRVPIGASGAAGTHQGRGLVVAKSDTGVYTATLQGGTTGVGAILYAACQIVSDTPQVATVKSAVASTGIVTFECHTLGDDGSDDNTEPGNGDHLMVTVIVRNSPADSS